MNNEEPIYPVEQKRVADVASITNPDYGRMKEDPSTPMATRMLAAINAPRYTSDLTAAANDLREGSTPGNVYGLGG